MQRAAPTNEPQDGTILLPHEPAVVTLGLVLSPYVVELEVRDPYSIWVRFDDGTAGEVDLSDSAETGGIFSAWSNTSFWRGAHIVPDTNAVAWGSGNEVDVCPHSLYLDLTGQSFDELRADASTLMAD